MIIFVEVKLHPLAQTPHSVEQLKTLTGWHPPIIFAHHQQEGCFNFICFSDWWLFKHKFELIWKIIILDCCEQSLKLLLLPPPILPPRTRLFSIAENCMLKIVSFPQPIFSATALCQFCSKLCHFFSQSNFILTFFPLFEKQILYLFLKDKNPW